MKNVVFVILVLTISGLAQGEPPLQQQHSAQRPYDIETIFSMAHAASPKVRSLAGFAIATDEAGTASQRMHIIRLLLLDSSATVRFAAAWAAAEEMHNWYNLNGVSVLVRELELLATKKEMIKPSDIVNNETDKWG